MEKMAFLFPGQGSHYVGMGKSIYENYEIVKQTFEEANDVLGINLAKLSFDGPLGDLTRADNAYPAIITLSVAYFRLYMKELGIVPQFCVGHSLGEYSAFVCAGALSFADALKVVRLRGELAEEMVKAGESAMTIIDGVNTDLVESICREISSPDNYVAISNHNSPDQCSVSGHQKAVMTLEEKILQNDCQVTPLIASAPFHCSLMQPAAEKIREVLEQCFFGYFKYPVVVNASARPLTDPDKIIDNLVNQMVKPVQWRAAMEYLKKKGTTMTIEMSGKNVLTNLVKANVDGIEALCYGIKEDRKLVGEILSAYPDLKKHIPTVITRCLAIAVATPNKNFDNDEYDEKVIKSYRRIEEIQDELEKKEAQATKEQMVEALDLLKVILKTKKVDIDEQIRWFRQIIDETGMYYELNDYELPARQAAEVK